jgi:hypothetical protein
MSISIDGKAYNIQGLGQIILYPISKLSQALTDAGYPRDQYTIREEWIKKKFIPAPLFYLKKRRMWSIEQINLIVQTVAEFNLRQGLTDKQLKQEFTETLWKRWDKLNAELYLSQRR